MTDTLSKLEVLRDVYDPIELDLMVEKLLGITLSRQRARLARYDRDLRAFEERYHLDSNDVFPAIRRRQTWRRDGFLSSGWVCIRCAKTLCRRSNNWSRWREGRG